MLSVVFVGVLKKLWVLRLVVLVLVFSRSWMLNSVRVLVVGVVIEVVWWVMCWFFWLLCVWCLLCWWWLCFFVGERVFMLFLMGWLKW